MNKDSYFALKFKRFLTLLSPELNTRVVYWFKFHKPIDLNNPRTLDEKIQWLKLNTYKDNPLVRQCADKYRVRDYVSKCGCGEILNNLIGAYDTVDDIPWAELPNSFVIKWNFGCGENIIVRDKKQLNIQDAQKQLLKWYNDRNKFYLTYSELQYKDVPPKIVCEDFIKTKDGDLPVDYKVYCFNGEPDSVLICSGRSSGHTEYYFFSQDWQLRRYNRRGKEAPDGFTLPKPQNIEAVFEYARRLSRPFPFVRADFYLEDGKVFFGELTFTPCGGFDVNRLPETQLHFGNMVDLSYHGV